MFLTIYGVEKRSVTAAFKKEQQISANPVSTLGPWSTLIMGLSNICFVLVFECGRPGLQRSTVPLSVHPSRGGRPRIELSENGKSVPLGPVFQLNMRNKMQISSYLRLSSKTARLGFTGAIEKAETQRQ